MAEFQEVIRQWNRMCKSIGVHDRIKCQFVHAFDIPNCESCSDYALEDPAKTEEIVMAWAAEHPEPVYPRWVEWLHDNGIILDARQHNETEHWLLGIEAMRPIPADIAEKLGLQPKPKV